MSGSVNSERIKIMTLKLVYIFALLFILNMAGNAGTPPQANSLTVHVRAFIEGRYDLNCHCMIPDSVDVVLYFDGQGEAEWLRQRGALDGTGNVTVHFQNVPYEKFFLGIQHRNSIRTWSSHPFLTDANTFSYDFTTSSSQAYYDNMTQMHDGRWCLFSGDVDQNQFIDSNDLLIVDNDAYNMVSGDVVTDLDGNGFVDNNDLMIVDNNANYYAGECFPKSEFDLPLGRGMTLPQLDRCYYLTDHLGSVKMTVGEGPTTAGLAGYWAFEGTCEDESDNGNIAELINTSASNPVSYTAEMFGGKYGQGVTSNGTTGYIDLGNSQKLHPSIISISAWIKPTSLVAGKENEIVVEESFGYRFFYQGDGSLRLLIRDTNADQRDSNNELYYGTVAGAVKCDGSWQHVAATYGIDRRIHIYVDGELKGTGPQYTGGDGTIKYSSPSTVTVGSAGLPAHSFWRSGMIGIIDEVKIYDRELTLAEIQRDYTHDVAILGYDDYDPWGKQLEGRCMNSSNTDDKLKFTGKERDKESGYDYFGHRLYDSDIAKWLQVDPLAEKYPGWSPYNYCLNNPIRLVDPDGMEVRINSGDKDKNGNIIYVTYTAGMEYKGDNKFVATTIYALNNMNSVNIGSKVLSDLILSDNKFTFQNVNSDGGANTLQFIANSNGGGDIRAAALLGFGTAENLESVSHELFHGYQYENKSAYYGSNAEVESYLFGRGIYGSFYNTMPLFSGNNSQAGGEYAMAMKDMLLSNKFDIKTFNSAVGAFSAGNPYGDIYKNSKVYLNTTPLISKFFPLWK